MAIFSGKVVSATFADSPTNTLIEVLYQEENGLTSYILEVDFTHSDFKSLLQEVTLDEIESNTKAVFDIEKKFFVDAVEKEIERRWALESEKVKKAYADVESYLIDEKKKAYLDAEQYTTEEKEKFVKELQSKFNGIADTAKITPKNIIDYFNDIHDDKDAVFNMKIAVLEDPIIAKSKDKSLKMKIRKAKSVFEILEIYSPLKV